MLCLFLRGLYPHQVANLRQNVRVSKGNAVLLTLGFWWAVVTWPKMSSTAGGRWVRWRTFLCHDQQFLKYLRRSWFGSNRNILDSHISSTIIRGFSIFNQNHNGSQSFERESGTINVTHFEEVQVTANTEISFAFWGFLWDLISDFWGNRINVASEVSPFHGVWLGCKNISQSHKLKSWNWWNVCELYRYLSSLKVSSWKGLLPEKGWFFSTFFVAGRSRCYAPTPAKNITVLPTDDYMAPWAQGLWGRGGASRDDLGAIRQMYLGLYCSCFAVFYRFV